MTASNKKPFIHCKDHSVSGRMFSLVAQDDNEVLMTVPQPTKSELPSFYNSEDYISHNDSSSGVMDRIYQWVKSYMISKKLKWIRGFQTEGRLLDIGAGTGDFLLEAEKQGWDVYGIEPSGKARGLAERKGVELESEDHVFESGSFDLITMWHVLEHVPDLEWQISELKRLLKPGGMLVVAVPNYKSHDANVYGEFWAAYDVPRHLWHFSREALQGLFSERGFTFLENRPLKFDAFYVSLLSEKHKTGSTNFLSALKNGISSNLKAERTGEFSSIAYFFQKDRE